MLSNLLKGMEPYSNNTTFDVYNVDTGDIDDTSKKNIPAKMSNFFQANS